MSEDRIAEARARLFRFVEAGAEEEDLPTFAAALNELLGLKYNETLGVAAHFLAEIGTPISGSRSEHERGIMYASERLRGLTTEVASSDATSVAPRTGGKSVQGWAVYMEVSAVDVTPEAHEEISDRLAGHYGVTTTGETGRLGAQLTVSAETLPSAIAIAMADVTAAALGVAGLTVSPVRVEAMSEEEFDTEQAEAATAAALLIEGMK